MVDILFVDIAELGTGRCTEQEQEQCMVGVECMRIVALQDHTADFDTEDIEQAHFVVDTIEVELELAPVDMVPA